MSDKSTMTRGTVNLNEEALKALPAQVRGDLIRPGDAQYEEARKVYNGMIDKNPALIVRCVGTADVISIVNFAREQHLDVVVRGRGHTVFLQPLDNHRHSLYINHRPDGRSVKLGET